jgi:hypothetical protein
MSNPGQRPNWMIPAALGVVALAGIALVGGMAIGHASANKAASGGAVLSPTPTATPATGLGSVASGGAAAASPATVTVTVTATITAGPSGPPASTGVVVDLGGTGSKSTANFTVAANQWTIAYTYDCANAGGEGSFLVNVHSSDGTSSQQAVSELGANGQDSTVEHGSGTYFLSVTSACAWHLTVTS